MRSRRATALPPRTPSAAPAGGASDGDEPAETAGEVVDVTFPEMGDSVAEGTILEWRVAARRHGGRGRPAGGDLDRQGRRRGALARGRHGDRAAGRAGRRPSPWARVLCRIEAGAGAPRTGSARAQGRPTARPGHARHAATRRQRRRRRHAGGRANGGRARHRPRRRERQRPARARDQGRRGGGHRGQRRRRARGSAAPAGGATEPIRGPAATLARFMDESRSIPTATSFRTLAVDALADRRGQLKAAGKKLSFTHLIAWAIVRATDDMPVMAHSFAEVEGKPHRVTPASVSLGLAVDVERKDGTRSLVVPVIRDAVDARLRRLRGRLRRGGGRRPRQQACAGRLPGRADHADQPRAASARWPRCRG